MMNCSKILGEHQEDMDLDGQGPFRDEPKHDEAKSRVVPTPPLTSKQVQCRHVDRGLCPYAHRRQFCLERGLYHRHTYRRRQRREREIEKERERERERKKERESERLHEKLVSVGR